MCLVPCNAIFISVQDLLSIYCVLGAVVGTGNSVESKTNTKSVLLKKRMGGSD